MAHLKENVVECTIHVGLRTIDSNVRRNVSYHLGCARQRRVFGGITLQRLWVWQWLMRNWSAVMSKRLLVISYYVAAYQRAASWLSISIVLTAQLVAQTYSGTNATGQVVFSTTVNLTQIAQAQTMALQTADSGTEKPKAAPKLPLPPAPIQTRVMAMSPMSSLPVQPSGIFGFSALTHFDQRSASSGNQFSIEPPSPSIAVNDTYILEGVNNAVQVYSRTGTPLLPAVLASNQVFGVAPAINRSTNIAGVYPTDMRVFYDQGISRWFIVQRAQCCDAAGNNINRSQIYIAASQTSDPRGNYNVYVIDTTDSSSPFCPMGCVSDYPQIGSDQNAFFISANEYPLDFLANPSQFPDGITIWAISKNSLSTGAAAPNAYKFALTRTDALIFSVQPASTPPGASFAFGGGGVEFFLSTVSTGGGSAALWAMTNTSAVDHLSTSAPSLIRAVTNTITYNPPSDALQRAGPLPYGSTQIPGYEPPVDGSDSRMLCVAYSGGRLYATFGTQVKDENGRLLAGVAYMIFSPTLRGGVLSPNILRQGFLLVNNNNLLRPAVAVNARGSGAITFTLVGPDYYPSAAFLPISTFSTGTTIQLAAPGAFPEDGFTGYEDSLGNVARSTARWGDYSTAVVGSDGSVWMATQFIPNSPRTEFANWGTYIAQLVQ